MGSTTKIEWTDHTFNPWWGCLKVSPECDHCYAEAFAKRIGQKIWGPEKTTKRRFFGDAHWREPEKWDRAALEAGERRRVFCASMADVFEDRRDLDEHRVRLWSLIERTQNLDWLLLTKRPENMERLSPETWSAGWPMNIWAGTTAGDQKRADLRLAHLRKVPALTRFVSYEPALGEVDWKPLISDGAIHWIIVGGESGGGSRPFDIAWARKTVKQCAEAGIACFVKQLGAYPLVELGGKLALPTRVSKHDQEQRPTYKMVDAKGGDWSEWPKELRVRQFPRPALEGR